MGLPSEQTLVSQIVEYGLNFLFLRDTAIIKIDSPPLGRKVTISCFRTSKIMSQTFEQCPF